MILLAFIKDSLSTMSSVKFEISHCSDYKLKAINQTGAYDEGFLNLGY